MIKYRLKSLIADKEYKDGDPLRMEAIAKATKLHRTTLSKIANKKGYKTTTDVLDRLCKYFGVSLAELAEYVPDKDNSDEDTKTK